MLDWQAFKPQPTSLYQAMPSLWEAACNALHNHGFPTKKNEAWRYFPIQKMHAFQPCTLGKNYTIDQDLPPELIFCSAEEALLKYPQHMHELLNADLPSHGFEHFNLLFAKESYFIYLPANTDLSQGFWQLIQSAIPENKIGNIRIFLLLDEGSRLNMAQEYSSNSQHPQLNNIVFHIHLRKKAHLDLCLIQNTPNRSSWLHNLSVVQAAHSHFSIYAFNFAGNLARVQTNVLSQGSETVSNLHCLQLPSSGSYHDFQATVTLTQPKSKISQHNHAMIAQRGQSSARVSVIAQPQASQASCDQKLQSLLLAPGAIANNKPELEIYCKQIQAKHGSTIGQLDYNALYYLKTRGFSEALAKATLMQAFCESFLNQSALQPYARKLRQLQNTYVKNMFKVSEALS
jgi:Fe-S cluster assembly protein SufD